MRFEALDGNAVEERHTLDDLGDALKRHQQEADRQVLLSKAKKGDKVVTSGGIIGVIHAIKDKEDEATLKIDDNANVKLRVTKSSILRILSTDEAAKEPKEGA